MIGQHGNGSMQQDLFDRLHGLGATALEFLQGRVALLQWELAQEKSRLSAMLTRALLCGFFLLLSVQLLVILLVALTWETPWRMHVIVGLLGLAVIVTGGLAWGFRAKQQEDSPLFSNTLHELAKDRQGLESLK